MMYDLAVVGTGPAGYSAAFEAVRNGLSVVVFEKEDGDGGAPGTGARIEIAVNAVGRPSVRLEGDSRR